jgi:hypothetical protein
MENQEKINPTAYVKVLDIFLDRLTVKRIIPIPYKNAVNEVLYDMDSMFDDEDNRKAFRGVIDNFKEQTNLEGWYEGEYDNR